MQKRYSALFLYRSVCKYNFPGTPQHVVKEKMSSIICDIEAVLLFHILTSSHAITTHLLWTIPRFFILKCLIFSSIILSLWPILIHRLFVDLIGPLAHFLVCLLGHNNFIRIIGCNFMTEYFISNKNYIFSTIFEL